MRTFVHAWPTFRRGLLAVLLLSLFAVVSPTLFAQPGPAPQVADSARLLSEEAEVSILTIYPGPEVHARFGHTAIRVLDPQRDVDWVYNYGTFDFDSPLFVGTFIRGRLDYYLSVVPMDHAMYHYQHVERRAVVEQVLDLTRAEREAVFEYLLVNVRPENRTYRYHFLYDNCSTRVRDVFEHVLGPSLSFDRMVEPTVTYRQMLQPYMADARLMQFGVNLAMARPADRAVGRRDVMFLPLPLKDAFDLAMVERDGAPQALVRLTERLYWLDGADEAGHALPWPAMLLWAGLVVGVGATWREMRRVPVAPVPGRLRALVGDAVLLGLAGLTGLVLLGLWLGTEHDVAGPNWNLLWAWPTHLLAAVALWLRPGWRWLHRYLLVTAVATLASAVTWPLWPQALPWPVVPLLLLIALRAAWLSWRLRAVPEADGPVPNGASTVTSAKAPDGEPAGGA